MGILKKSSAAAIALAASLMSSNAHAASQITISGPSGNFGDDNVICAAGVSGPCAFEREYLFATPVGFNLASINVSTIASLDNMTNIDFSTVTFNGVNLQNLFGTGREEQRRLFDQALVTSGSNRIFVSGTTGGNASFAGNLSFAAAAVPEPATWLMMLLGFGAIGHSMRGRKSTARTQFA